jgi:two-component system, response regulator YesN
MNHNDLHFFHSLTDLNVQFFFNNGKKSLSIPSGPLTLEELSQINISSTIEDDKIYFDISNLRDSTGLRFLVLLFDEGRLVLGPFILDEDPPLVLGRGLSLGLTIPIKTIEKIEAFNQLLKMRLQTEPDFDNKILNEIETHNPSFEGPSEIDIDRIERRYKDERLVRHLIASGAKSEMMDLYKSRADKIDYDIRIPNNPLRVLKNYSIILNSIGRLSAEKGGLPPFLLHSISEKYAIKIESQDSEKGIRELQKNMLFHYCDAVYNYRIENHSAYIVKASQYILLNLHRKLKLKKIAQVVDTNSSYLSRRFKEETGQTIWSYIREKRILEARWMLIQTELSITDIALSLGFDDVNYFSKVFRKERGISPREYRQKHRRDDFDGLPD